MRASLDHWPIGALQVRPEGSACNQQARELLGLGDQPALPDPFSCLQRQLQAPHRERFLSLWHRGRIDRKPWRCDVELLPGTACRWLRIQAQCAPEGVWTLTLVDISDLINTATPANQDDLGRTALNITEAIPVGTYTMVLEPGSELASFRFMSERFLELTGLEREGALADPLKAFACVHPDDYDTWLQLNAEAFQNKAPFFGQTRVVVKGEVRWITAESIPRDLPDGSTVWEGVLIDVTDRILAQKQLEKSQETLKKILNNIPVAISLAAFEARQGTSQPKARISFINETFERTFGYTLNEIPTQEAWEVRAFPDPDYRREVFEQWDQAMERAMAQKGRIEQAEYRVQAKDGRSLQVLINAVGLEDGALVALIDVTRMRHAERELLNSLQRERDKEEQLRRSAEEKLRVSLSATAVAHEIRQPLSSILMKSKMALKELDRIETDSGSLRRLITPLAEEAQQMAAITDRISLLLRNVETERRELDLRQLIQGALLPLRGTLRSPAIEPKCKLPETACVLRGDAIQLQLAIANLVRNSVEALKQASTPAPELRLTLAQPQQWLELRVADNGPGFANAEALLQPLSSTKEKGSGIGLYVVSLTMDNHGGSIELGRSAELGGAEVTLRLPALSRAAL